MYSQHAAGVGTGGIAGSMAKNVPAIFKNCIAVDDVKCVGNQFLGTILGATSSYASQGVSIDNCYAIGDSNAVVGIVSRVNFVSQGCKESHHGIHGRNQRKRLVGK